MFTRMRILAFTQGFQMYQFEVHYYVQGISGQLVQIITAANRQGAEAAVKAMYSGRSVTIHRVVRL